jgi:hypothetical protein
LARGDGLAEAPLPLFHVVDYHPSHAIAVAQGIVGSDLAVIVTRTITSE